MREPEPPDDSLVRGDQHSSHKHAARRDDGCLLSSLHRQSGLQVCTCVRQWFLVELEQASFMRNWLSSWSLCSMAYARPATASLNGIGDALGLRIARSSSARTLFLHERPQLRASSCSGESVRVRCMRSIFGSGTTHIMHSPPCFSSMNVTRRRLVCAARRARHSDVLTP
jgi:hypothetical protein